MKVPAIFLGTCLRFITSGLFSFLLAIAVCGQVQPSAYPSSAAEKTLQGVPLGGVQSIDCSSNNASVQTCLGGPITQNGTLTLTWATQAQSSVLTVPTSGGAQLPGFSTDVPRVICKVPSTVDVANTASETTIYDCLVPANTLGTVGSIHFLVMGDWLYDNVLGDTIIIKAKYGCADAVAACGAGQVMHTEAAIAPEPTAITTNRRAFRWEIDVFETGASTTSQTCNFLHAHSGRDNTGTFTRNGSSPGMITTAGNCSASTTINTTAASHFLITVTWSAASANNSWRSLYAYGLSIP